ncbi:MAG: hypothetical protein ABJH07_24145 [Sedimentitalea sp.]|uniref:hypothetical protein n=1 Tax=Sedimentitalea sp. TaxID=2048915 RepID=UPI003264ECE2
MTLPAPTLLLTPDTQVRRAVRRLRWFRRAFLEQVAVVSEDCGIPFDVDTIRLADAFLQWSAAFERKKPTSRHDKRRYVEHVSGLMLDQLLRKAPLSARPNHNARPSKSPSHFWPEGYACVVFCLNVRAAVLAQDFGETVEDAPQMENLRDWMSFRENVVEKPESAISFLQHFAGLKPDWQFPDLFHPSPRQSPPQLTLVRSPDRTARQELPSDLSLIVFDLDSITNSRALVAQALTQVLGRYGYALSDELIDQPLAAAMTHVALRSGKLCPSGFTEHFRSTLSEIFAARLQLSPPVRGIFDELSAKKIKVRIALNDAKTSVPDLLNVLNLEDLAELYEAADLAQVATPSETSVWVSADGSRLQAAHRCGFQTLGIADRTGCEPRHSGQNITSMTEFPSLRD